MTKSAEPPVGGIGSRGLEIETSAQRGRTGPAPSSGGNGPPPPKECWRRARTKALWHRPPASSPPSTPPRRGGSSPRLRFSSGRRGRTRSSPGDGGGPSYETAVGGGELDARRVRGTVGPRRCGTNPHRKGRGVDVRDCEFARGGEPSRGGGNGRGRPRGERPPSEDAAGLRRRDRRSRPTGHGRPRGGRRRMLRQEGLRGRRRPGTTRGIRRAARLRSTRDRRKTTECGGGCFSEEICTDIQIPVSSLRNRSCRCQIVTPNCTKRGFNV